MAATRTQVQNLIRVPRLGTTLAYTRDPLALMRYLYERHGPVAPVPAPVGRAVFVLGPDACGQAMQNADKALINGWQTLVGPFFNRGLMLLDGAEHMRHRRILQQAFTRSQIEAYTAALHPAVRVGLDEWSARDGFLAYPALKELTLNLATTIFMGGHRIATQEELDRVNRAFVACVQAAGAVVRANVPGGLWHRATRGRAVLEEFLYRQLPRAKEGDGKDLFSALCLVRDEDGSGFSDADVVNHMIFLLMAAHDTSTSTLSSAMYFLATHPQWQERLRQEVRDLGPDPSVEALEQLPLTAMVIKECQRLVAPVPVLSRRTARDTVIAGRAIPADTSVVVALQLSHMLPQYWSDPESFDPERFSPERREDKSHRHAWSPFGAGVHKCLGMAFSDIEVRTILAQLLGRFSWSVPAGYRPPMSNVSLPYPKDGLPVVLRALPTIKPRIAA